MKIEQTKKIASAGRVLSGLAAFPFIPSSIMKLIGHESVIKGFEHFGLPDLLILPLGIVELSCVALYIVPQTATLGAILLTGYIGGAMLTHLRINEPIVLHIGLGILVWLGLFLREPRMREVLPFRSGQH